MYLKLNIILLLVIGFFNSVFSQDKLIKNDGTELKVKVIEISDTEIKYKMFDNLEGPLYINPKSDFVRAEYKNGGTETFKSNTQETQLKTTATSKIREGKIGDWIKFNVDAGLAYSKSFSIIPFRLDDSGRHGNGNTYSRNSASKTDCFSPYLGLNFIFGKDDVVRHLMGVSYLNVKTNYDHGFSSGFTPSYGSTPPPYYAQSTLVSVSGNYHVMAINCGINFEISKKLNLCLIGSVGTTIEGATVSNGYRVDYITVADTVYPGTRTYTETVLIENEKSKGESINFYSIQGKIYYDFKIKENLFGVYLLGNYSAINRLPYCAIGLSYYPFKKLQNADI